MITMSVNPLSASEISCADEGKKDQEFHSGLSEEMEKIEKDIRKAIWTVPQACRPAELNPDNRSFKNKATKCSFYSCADTAVVDAGICKARDKSSYFLNYGEKYCNRFSDKTLYKLSEKGQVWLNKTLVCLQQAIVDFCHDGACAKCENIRKLSYASHAPCYTDSGLCYLNPIDLFQIGLTPDFKADVLNRDGLIQIAEVGGLCGGQLAYNAMKTTVNSADYYSKKAAEWSAKVKKVAHNSIDNLLY